MKQKQLDFRRGRAFRSFAALVCLLLLGVSGVRAQSRYEVSGAVTDRNAQPVAGASVVEKGTNRGTVTSADGSYTIRISSDKAVLVYSFFGCKTQEIAVAGRTRIDITLQEDAIALEEVVAIGYGSMKKSDLTGAVSSIKSELLENKPIASFDNALRGQIAGVQVRQNDGQPGGGCVDPHPRHELDQRHQRTALRHRRRASDQRIGDRGAGSGHQPAFEPQHQ